MRGRWLMGLLLLLVGCSQQLSDYEQSEPALDLQQFFDGSIKAWGVISSRNGTIKRRFSATIEASWQGNEGTLDEIFQFDDGETQTRVWTLIKQGDRYLGKAGDVVGEAKGETAGFAMNWHYQLLIPISEQSWQFHIDDWLYQIDSNIVINQGEIRKFGVKVGQITLFMQKQPTQKQPSPQ